MHDYLQAIGFDRSMKRAEKDDLLLSIVETPDEKLYFRTGEDSCIVQYNKDFGDPFGISLVGEMDENGELTLEYVYPYVKGKNMFFHEEIHIEKYSDRDAYAGICDNVNLGVPLIFYIHNFIHYLNMSQYKEMFPEVNNVVLAGLSLDGTVILNVEKDEKQIRKERKSDNNRNQLLEAAREGNMEAIEMLTLDDMDTYTMISKRAKREDVFTIVDSYCIPYGVETDKYSILGTIYDVAEYKNQMTGKEIYYLSIGCNNLEFDICINKSDLLGEPLKGRRFKGVVWLQGMIDYI